MTRAMLVGILLSGTFLAGTTSAFAQDSGVIDVGQGHDFEIHDIQTAVNRARPGTTIRVHPGTYYEGVNITRSGTADNRIRIESVVPGGAHVVGGSKPAFSAFGQDNIGIVGFRMSSDTDGVKIGGNPSRDAQNIEFTGNTLEGSGGDGFKFFQTKGLNLQGNTIKQAGLSRNSNGDGGIDLVGVDDSTIKGNAVLSTYGYACLMMKGGSDGNTVTGNRFVGCERDGITVGGFTGDKFMDASDKGLEAHNNTITGNEIGAGDDKCPFYFHEAASNRIADNKTVGGRTDCRMADGSNNANTQVDTSNAGSGDNSGDLYEGSGESESLDAEMRSAMSNVDNLSCGKGGVMNAVSVAAGAVTSFFGGGKATYAGQMMQQAQHILGNICLSEQTAIQAKGIASGEYDTRSDTRRGMNRVNNLLGDVVNHDWVGSYPEQYSGMDQQTKIIWDDQNVQRQHAAGQLSKQTANEAIQGLQTMPDRSVSVLGAAQDAPGALAVGQAEVQATMMGVEVQSMALSTQIAHNQVVEAKLDKEAAAERRAIEYRKRMRRGLPGYEGDGGLGLLLSGDE